MKPTTPQNSRSSIPRLRPQTKLITFTLTVLLLACASLRAAETIPLAGEWRFSLAGTNDLTGHIKLPGTMDDAGLGPKNTKSPTLEGPYRLHDYAGPAWYQRDIEIPTDWNGKRVTLFLERCRWVTTVWLDDNQVGSQDSLIAPHVYDFGTGVAPGKHRLTICVDNTVKINLGRFVSALFGGTWGNMNGIVGRIELAATPPVWIDDVQVYPNVAKKTALVKVRIGNATGKAGQGALSVGSKTVVATWDANGGQAEIEVVIDAKPWDEFAPNLTRVTVKLGDSERTVRFGLREFGAKGTQFTMNNRPVYLRGTLECSIWPLTGYPPTDVAAWHRIYKIMKSYGLNHIRFHSWCPPEAAFAAADEEGIMVQAEGPMANVDAGLDPVRDAFIEAEFKRIVDTYGNHPSFCMMTLGNEYGGKMDLLTRWVDMLEKRDPRHLYSSAANNGNMTANRQFTEGFFGRGVHGAGTANDVRRAIEHEDLPPLGHEIGQWMYWPDSNEIRKWTGVMALKNYEMIRDDLARKHLLDLEPQFVQASGKFATLLYKEEIELLLRTPGFAGFSLLDLHDYPTQGTALVGPLDAFWDSKGFITPEAYRRFCGATVPLLRMPKRTYSADEPFEATVDVAHYGAADIANAKPAWTIKDDQGREIAGGTLPEQNVPTGKLTSLGAIKAPLEKAGIPCKLTVTVSLGEFSNDWEIWVYPANAAPKPPADVVVCAKWDEAKAALGDGKKVVFFPKSTDAAYSMNGAFLPVFWSPVWFPSQKPNTMGLLCDPKHPFFAQFPTEMHSNWQWYELMQRSRLFILDDTPADFRPTLQVIDNFERNHKLGVVFEGRVGAGQLLVCGFELPAMAKEPAARQLLASLYHYAGSPAFRPAQELGGGLLEKMFANKLQELHAQIRADSQHPDHVAAHAIDGDLRTIWHTPWNEPVPKFPHELVIELPKPVKISGITCLPRQDGPQDGWIKDYAVHISADGKDWGQPVAKGAFKPDANLHTVKFEKPVETRFLKFVALDGFEWSKKTYASLAELSLIFASAPILLGAPGGAMQVAINPDNGVIASLTYAADGSDPVKVAFRDDALAGPAFAGVALQRTKDGEATFGGMKDGVEYTLKYAVKGDALSITAGMKNTGSTEFAPLNAGLVLGLNTEMPGYPEWNDRFFPTLLRCEKTHFWGYLMTPKGKILTIGSGEPIASYAMNYNVDRNQGGHLIYTCTLDLLHALPLPPRHPQNLVSLKPGEKRNWTIYLQPAGSLDDVKPILAASLSAPMIDADRYTLAAGESSLLTIRSSQPVKVKATGPDGGVMSLPVESKSKTTGQVKFTPAAGPGLYTVTATGRDGHQSEACISVRHPWSWYMNQARKEAIHHKQYASSHLEQWLGLQTGVLARWRLPEATLDAQMDQRLKEILRAQWDLDKKVPTNIPHGSRNFPNTAQMAGLLAYRYFADQDTNWLDLASGFADYAVSRQSADGNYVNYTTVFYPVKSVLTVVAAEKQAMSKDGRFKAAFNRHYDSAKKAADFLVRSQDNLITEGELTFEDGMISCSGMQMGLFALIQKDAASRERYAEAARKMLASHRCLEQLLIPDSRMNGATLRFWEAQYDTLIGKTRNMVNSPHGWSAWLIPGLWYQYLLTGEEAWLQKTMNAMGSCAQLVDSKTGELRWAFVPDPYRDVTMLEPNPDNPMRGKRVERIIGEQYVPMIAAFHYPDHEPISGNSPAVGWTCCNDVHEVFIALEEVALTSAYVLQRADGQLVTWNCSASRGSDGTIAVTPAEKVVSRVHINLTRPETVEIRMPGNPPIRTKCEPGMRWLGPGGVPELLREI